MVGGHINISHKPLHKMSASRRLTDVAKFTVSFVIVVILNNVIGLLSLEPEDYFLCRKCGHEVVHLSHLMNVPAAAAVRQRNDTFGSKEGVLIQLFKNPMQKYFEVITSTEASIRSLPQEYGEETWFKDYNWKISVCPRCGHHLGWEYVPMDKNNNAKKTFFGLILSNLLYQNEMDNLIVVPKSYTS